nr:stalk domain-containing protein [Desulforamulus aeronauticus]
MTGSMDVKPQLINGRVMVPAKYVAEGLGAKVEWDIAQNAVVINSNGAQHTVGPSTSTIPAASTTPAASTAPALSNDEIAIKDQSGKVLYTLKINKVTTMSERNQYSDKKPAQVVNINYSYKNISNSEDVYIFDEYFKVFDKDGNVGYTYPNTINKYPQKIPSGATCTADMIFGLDSKSDTLKLSFYKNMFDNKDYQTFNMSIN